MPQTTSWAPAPKGPSGWRHDTLQRTRVQLASDVELLGPILVSKRASPSQLENEIVRFSVDRDVSHISLIDRGGRMIGGDGRAHWARLPIARALRRRAATGSPVSATAVSNRGEPLMLAAMRVRGVNGQRTVMLGRAIDRDLLAPVERSLGVLFNVETRTASGTTPRRTGSLQEDGTGREEHWNEIRR